LAVASLAPPAAALRVMSYNILNYSSGRTDEFRLILAETSPDVLVVQEILSQTAVNTFLATVLDEVDPGEWAAGGFVNGYDTDNAIFYRPARVQYLSHHIIDTSLRDIDEWTIRPAGYAAESANLRLYVVHLKASSGTSEQQQRLAEVTAMRTRMETFPAGQHYLVAGDFNIYTSSEPAYGYMLGTGAGMAGVVADPIDAPGSWHNSSYFAWLHTQSPRTTQFGGGANGGMDDRFDMILTSPALLDGEGFEILPGSYTPYGNDGLHFNVALTDAPANQAVSAEIAQAIHDASDHLPLFADFNVPSILSTVTALDFGAAITGGAASRELFLENAAVEPADDLDYSFAAPSGFAAPTGSFNLDACDGEERHTIAMSTASAGWKSGDLILTTDAPDALTHAVALTGVVLDHARPSLSPATVATAGAIDFGAHAPEEFTPVDATVYNYGCHDLQAALEIHDAELTGDARFAFAGGFVPQTAEETPASWSLEFDAAGAATGDYSATLTFSTRDPQGLPGATGLADLVYELTATVSSGAAAPEPVATCVGFATVAPNPFRATALLEYGLTAPGPVRLAIYDVTGREVRRLIEAERPAGIYQIAWDGRDRGGRLLPTGIYYARLATPDVVETRMLVRCD
jgi:endonuclease/exonuclease/phosphatase family metal-dependent hydrolase